MELGLKGLVGGFDSLDVTPLEGFAHLRDLVFDGLLGSSVDLLADFGELLLGLVGERVGIITNLNALLGLAVIFGMGFGFLLHALYLFLAETTRSGNGDFLLLARSEILGGDIKDAVGIDVKRDLDLRCAARCRWDAIKMEDAKLLVVTGERSLSLENLDLYPWLVVAVGGEDIALLSGDRGVARDHRSSDTSSCLDCKGQRGDIEKKNILHITAKHPTLDGGTDRHNFIRIDTLVGLFSDHVAGGLDDLGHAGHSSDQNELVHFAFLPLGIAQAVFDRLDGALEEIVCELFELGPSQFLLYVLRSARIGSDKGEIDLVLLRGGEGYLGLFGFLFDTLNGIWLLGEINAGLSFEFTDDPFHDAVVPVVSTQMGVTVGSTHLKDTISEFKGRNVKGASTQIINGDLFILVFLKTIGQRSSGWLVDDAQHFKSGDLAGILGGIALGVIEISGNSNDCLGNLFTQLGLGIAFELSQNHGGYLGR